MTSKAPTRRFKLEELDSPEYLQYEIKKEISKPRCRSNNRKPRGGATENISLMRTLASTERELLRNNQQILEKLDLLITHLNILTNEELKKKFEDLEYKVEELEEMIPNE